MSYLDSMSFSDFALAALHKSSTLEFLEVLLIWCCVWFRRNDLLHDGVLIKADAVVSWARSYREKGYGFDVIRLSMIEWFWMMLWL
ncbi:hypothetical protein ACOSQ2_003416 [Xanthoceras sorbifolium]